MTSLVAQMIKHLPTMWETQIQSLGHEDLLEKEMATHSSILAWKIPWMEEPGGLQSMGSQSWTRLSDFTFLFTPCYKERMYLDQVLPFEQRPSLTQLQTSFQLSSSTSCIYPRKLNEQVHRKTHQWLFLVAKMSKCPSSEQKVSYPFNATLFSCKKVIR